MRDLHTVLISGYAKLPSSTTVEAIYNMVVVVVVFDERSGVIVDAEASMVTEITKHFVADLLMGYNLNDGPEALIADFEAHYHGNAKKALETAIRAVFAHYQEYLEEKGKLPKK